MDQLEALRAFVRVVELGGFSEAARRAGSIAPSSVTRQINWLEETLGVKLLVRSTRSVTPTEAGQLLYEHVTRILDDLDGATRLVAGLDAAPRGRLRVTAPVAFARIHLSRALSAFLRACPEVELDLVLTDSIVDIMDDRIDVAVRIGRPEPPSLLARKLAPHRRVVCGSPSYFAEHGVPRTPKDLARHRCLSFDYEPAAPANQREFSVWHFRKAGQDARVTVRGSLRANNSEVLLEAALDGVGVALLPTWLIGIHVKEGRLTCALGGYEANPQKGDVGIYALYPESRRGSAKVRRFIDHLVAHFGPRPEWDRVCFGKSRG